jgi:hypothetical protein
MMDSATVVASPSSEFTNNGEIERYPSILHNLGGGAYYMDYVKFTLLLFIMGLIHIFSPVLHVSIFQTLFSHIKMPFVNWDSWCALPTTSLSGFLETATNK